MPVFSFVLYSFLASLLGKPITLELLGLTFSLM